MIIGLARTSTLEQVAGLEAQIRFDLSQAYGCRVRRIRSRGASLIRS